MVTNLFSMATSPLKLTQELTKNSLILLLQILLTLVDERV